MVYQRSSDDEVFDVVMSESAQGGKPEKPSSNVCEIVRNEHDAFTMAD